LKTIRVYFKKLGRIKYISHLDINRCIQRAIKRSGLPVWYTEGFNPHIFLSFALPLSLGFESECESFDIRLIEDVCDSEVIIKLNSMLPDGLKAFEVTEPVMKPEKIAYAKYSIKLFFENYELNLIKDKFIRFLNGDSIIVVKKTKKGEKEVDLKPLFSCSDIATTEKSLDFELTIASGNTVNINPLLLIDEFCKINNIVYSSYQITRTAILAENMENFK